MNEEEKRLLDYYSRLSRYSQRIALAQIVFAAETEENARKIAQSKATPGPRYADRNPAPMGIAELAAEALNG